MGIADSSGGAFQAGKDVFKDIGKYDLGGFAAQLAYRFFLALFPFFIFLTALAGFLSGTFGVQNPVDRVMDLIGGSLPQDASSVLRGQLEEVTNNRNPGLLSVGIVGAIWAAAGGIGALMKGFNRIYEVEEARPLPVKYGLAVGLTLFGAAFILAAFLLLVVGQTHGTQVAADLGLSDTAGILVNVARLPVVVVLILLAVAVLYWAAPNVSLPFRLVSPGALFFALAWLIGTYLLGFYVSNFGNYNATYGALGGVVVLLLWFYLTGFLILLGAEINAYVARQKMPAEMERQGANVPGWDEEASQGESDRGGVATGRTDDGAERSPVKTPRTSIWRQLRSKPGQSILSGLVAATALAGVTKRLASKQR